MLSEQQGVPGVPHLAPSCPRPTRRRRRAFSCPFHWPVTVPHQVTFNLPGPPFPCLYKWQPPQAHERSGRVRVGERQGRAAGGRGGWTFSGSAPLLPRSAETRLPQAPPPGPGPDLLTSLLLFPGGFCTRIVPGFGQQRRPLDEQECVEKLVKDSTEPHSQHPSGAQAHCPTQTTSWLPRADSSGTQGSSPALI